ncbi:MAG: hypothetical protein J1E41_06565, partial [Ruminococcus sp.]|nr:hypothetical protein [Ruminococcus sp.]
MKKLFCFILIISLLMATFVMSVNAESLEDEIIEVITTRNSDDIVPTTENKEAENDKYSPEFTKAVYDYGQKIGMTLDINHIEPGSAHINVYREKDEMIFFTINKAIPYSKSFELGGYIFINNCFYSENDIDAGFCVYSNGTVYKISDAVKLNITTYDELAEFFGAKSIDDLTTKELFKNYIDSQCGQIDNFIFKSFGEYNGFEVCYGGYELTKPWEPWAKIGNYAFKLNKQMASDEQMLGLYLVKDKEVLRLVDAYDNSYISDEDLSEFVKLIVSDDEYKRYFYIFDLVDFQVADLGDYRICYEGITNPYAYNESSQFIVNSEQHIKLGEYNIFVRGCGAYFYADNDSTKGLYVVNKENKILDLADAYKNSLLGTADELITLLNDSEFSGKGYWHIVLTSTEEKEPTTGCTYPTPPDIEEPTTSATEKTEPTEPKETVKKPTVKQANPMRVTAKTKTVKAKKLKKGKVTVKAVTVKKA